MVKIGNNDRYFDSIIRAIGLEVCDRLMRRFRAILTIESHKLDRT
ncbi:hypothetical protein [Kamptonema sp. UHCC 0994]|nr:hypothetical protein [Kamptonema sp. UHCC 0994]MDF0552485.1 hypothetical protein [Kamptonema sp. UHCC 0994]